MSNNSLTKTISFFKNLMIYKPPSMPSRFVLQENESEKSDDLSSDSSSLSESADELNNILRFAHRVEDTIEQAKSIISQAPNTDQINALQQKTMELKKQQAELSPILLAYNSEEDLEQRNISVSLE